MKKITLSLTIFAFATQLILAQDYRPGYIIKSDGNKINGMVAYISGQQRFQLCKFRNSENQETTDYSPDQILGYGFDRDSHYISATLKKDGIEGIQFAEVLVSGKLNLLQYNDSYFLQDEQKETFELRVTKNIVKDAEGKTKLKTTEEFKGILNWKFRDCPSAVEKIKTTRLNQEPLINIFTYYNSCFGESTVVFKEEKSWNQLYLGVSGGFIQGAIKDGPKSNTFPLGVGLFFTSPRRSEKLFGSLEIKYKPSKFKISETERVEFSQLQIPVSIGNMFLRSESSFRPTLELGFDYLILLKSDDKSIQPGVNASLLGFAAIGFNKTVKKSLIRLKAKYSLGSYVTITGEKLNLNAIEINFQYLFLISRR